MKIFNYQCTNSDCQHTQESFVKTSDQKVPCDKCGSETEKHLTMPAFILKGVGCHSNGTFAKAKEGPKLDQDLLRLPEKEFNYELGCEGVYE